MAVIERVLKVTDFTATYFLRKMGHENPENRDAIEAFKLSIRFCQLAVALHEKIEKGVEHGETKCY